MMIEIEVAPATAQEAVAITAARDNRSHCEKFCAHRCQQPNYDMEVIQLTRAHTTSLDAILSVLRDCDRA